MYVQSDKRVEALKDRLASLTNQPNNQKENGEAHEPDEPIPLQKWLCKDIIVQIMDK
jgi:hypothetical protein